MEYSKVRRIIRESGGKPKKVDENEFLRGIYTHLREPGPVTMVSGELDPALYNDSPVPLGLYQRLKEGWARYVYFTTLIMSEGEREHYFRAWREHIDNSIKFLTEEKSDTPFSLDELITFHKHTQEELKGTEDVLGDSMIFHLYPQGEILNVLDEQNGNLRLRTYQGYPDNEKARSIFRDYIEKEVKVWMDYNAKEFKFKVKRVEETDVMDIVCDPNDLSTLPKEAKESKLVELAWKKRLDS